jgi:hypothetical protein
MADDMNSTPIADTVAGGLQRVMGKRKNQTKEFMRRPPEQRDRPWVGQPQTPEEEADAYWSKPR